MTSLLKEIQELKAARAQHLARIKAIDAILASVAQELQGVQPVMPRAVAPACDVPDPQHHNTDAERAARITQLLEENGAAMSTAALARELRTDKKVLKKALVRLAKAGVITALGTGNGRRWGLPSWPSAASEVPHVNPQSALPEYAGRILVALRQQPGPVSPTTLCKLAQIGRFTGRRALRLLEQQGKVRTWGTTTDRRVALV